MKLMYTSKRVEYKEQLNTVIFILLKNKHLDYTFGIALIDHPNCHLSWICQVQLFLGSSGLYLENKINVMRNNGQLLKNAL